MPRVFALAVFSLLLAMGAGCAQPDVPAPTTALPLPVQYIAHPEAATSTEAVPNGWQPISFGGAWSLFHPGTTVPEAAVASVDRRAREFTLDLGTAVEGAGEKSVPRRTLVVDRLLPGNDFLSLGCVATTTAMGTPSMVSSTTTVQGVGVCVRRFAEGAAGSRYHTLSATLLTINAAYAVDYTVRSSECALYERPEEQCVAFDEARDTALFWAILATLRPGR
jgi:hypothetical protein